MTEDPIIETSPLICSANQWAGFYIIETSVMKELITISPVLIQQAILVSGPLCNASGNAFKRSS